MADEAPIVLRMGMALESSIEKSFQTVEQRAEKSGGLLTAAATKGGRGATTSLDQEWKKQLAALNKVAAAQDKLYERNSKNAAREAAKASKAAEREADRSAKAAERAAAREAAAAERSAKAREKASDEAARAAMRGFEQIARAARNAEQAEQRSTSRTVDRFATRTGRYAARAVIPYIPLASGAKHVASEIARGMGIDTSLSGAVARNVDLETQSIGLAQQERIATGGTTAGAAHYENIARNAGMKLAVDNTDPMELMRAFSGKTGEFDKLAEVVASLGPLAVASGTGFANMGESAGSFYNQVKHLPNALQLTEESMRGIIGQTAVGAVEMPDYASQMGRLAANAPRFGGDRAHVIMQQSALAQMAIERGGATSAADAARSVNAFDDTFSKNARLKAFKKYGVRVYEDEGVGPGKNTKLRDQFDIIKDVVKITGGNVPEIAEMFASTLAQKAVKGVASAYTDAGGGAAGVLAMDEAFRKYMDTVLTAEAEQKNLEDHLKSVAAQATQFQHEMDLAAKEIEAELLPAFKALKPHLVEAAHFVAKATESAVEHPYVAAAGVGMGVLGLAAIKAAIGGLVENAITGGAAAAGIGGGAAAAAGGGAATAGGVAAAGGLALAGAIVAAVGATLATGYNAYKLTKEVMATPGGASGVWHDVTEGPAKGTTREEYDRIYGGKKLAEQQAADQGADAAARGLPGGRGDGKGKPEEQPPPNKEQIRQHAELIQQVRKMEQELQQLRSGTLRVHVVNQVEPPGGRPAPTGRASQL